MSQLDLFATSFPADPDRLATQEAQHFELADGCQIRYMPTALASEFADALFASLLRDTPWQQDEILMFGKRLPLPRLTAWYGDPTRSYTYSGIAMQPHDWTESLRSLKTCVEAIAGVSFTSALLNFYRTGQDGVSWHADDEPELDPEAPIASVSLGATRRFSFKHQRDRALPKLHVELAHGSVLVMLPPTQEHWLHQIAKTRKPVGSRVNLTFRVIR